jgi:hypothetical protein
MMKDVIYADIVVSLQKNNVESISIESKQVIISVEHPAALDPNRVKFQLGTGSISWPQIESAPGQQVDQKIEKLRIGPYSSNLDTLLYLIGLVGDPASQFSFLIDASGEMGFQSNRGWSYQGGVSISWNFTPQIERTMVLE